MRASCSSQHCFFCPQDRPPPPPAKYMYIYSKKVISQNRQSQRLASLSIGTPCTIACQLVASPSLLFPALTVEVLPMDLHLFAKRPLQNPFLSKPSHIFLHPSVKDHHSHLSKRSGQNKVDLRKNEAKCGRVGENLCLALGPPAPGFTPARWDSSSQRRACRVHGTWKLAGPELGGLIVTIIIIICNIMDIIVHHHDSFGLSSRPHLILISAPYRRSVIRGAARETSPEPHTGHNLLVGEAWMPQHMELHKR